MSEGTSAGRGTDKLMKLVDTTTKKLVVIATLFGAIGSLVVKGKDLKAILFPPDTDAYYEIVLDTSANMNREFVDGTRLWDSALSVLQSIAPDYDRKNAKLGLRVFGGVCKQAENTSQLVDFSGQNSGKVMAAIKEERLASDADLLNALSGAVKDFDSHDRLNSKDLSNNVIVIMAGESCELEPLKLHNLKAELEKLGVSPAFRFVGLTPTGTALQQLSEVAEDIGGLVIPVNNDSELQLALQPDTERSQLQAMTWKTAEAYYKKRKDGKALPLFLSLAANGDAKGWLRAGNIYSTTKGSHEMQDFGKALEAYQKAWNAGLAEGAYRLGGMYRKGLGVTEDKQAAIEWYQKAVDKGYVKAQLPLAELQGEMANR